MRTETKTTDELLAENQELRARLDEAEETLRAIRGGEVDGLMVGDYLYTLQGVDAESNRFRGDVLAQVNDAVIALDSERRVTYLNPAAERLYEISASQVLGRSLDALYTERWLRPGDEAAAKKALARTDCWRGENIQIKRSGEEIRIESALSVLRDRSGVPVGVLAVVRNITARRHAEEEQSHLAAIVTSSSDAILSKTLDGIITSWNAGAERMFGFTSDEMIGQPVRRLIPAEIQDEEDTILAQLRAGKRIEHYETVRVAKGGRRFPVSLTISPLKDTAGNVIGASKIAHDITERKQAEEDVRRAGERFRFMAEHMPQKIFTARPDGAVDYFNEQWSQFTGLPVEELSGWAWSRIVHPDDLQANLRRWRQSVDTGAPFQIEHRFRRKDGVYRWHLSRAHAMRDAEGKVLMWIGSNTDIDDQKRAEERLETTVAERTAALSETVGELEAFSYSIAHDMRAPLRAMQGFASMLQDECLAQISEEGKDYLRRIGTSANRLDQLITDVLNYSKIIRGDLRLQPTDAERLIQEIIESYPNLHPIKADIQIKGPIQPVLANTAALTQVISNLLGNAIKFIDPGVRPRVRIWAEEMPNQAPTTVRIWFEDNGIGIHKEAQERIFLMFQRINPAGRYEGSGIGLTIVRKAIERMGGRVGVESDPGKGSRFWIELKKANAQ